MRRRDNVINRRGRELVALVSRHLPQELDLKDGSWPVVAHALLSRMATTLESILDLQARELEADAAILARSLYEHSVHFAWIAASPVERLESWRKHDILERLKADDDTRRLGIETLTPANRAFFEGEVGPKPWKPQLKPLWKLAEGADEFWVEKLPGLDPTEKKRSFRGMYAVLYRHYSGMAHPSAMGLNRVFDELGGARRRIRIEHKYQGNGPYGMATVLFGFALLVASQTIGWPHRDAVDKVFARYPDPKSGCLALLLRAVRRW